MIFLLRRISARDTHTKNAQKSKYSRLSGVLEDLRDNKKLRSEISLDCPFKYKAIFGLFSSTVCNSIIFELLAAITDQNYTRKYCTVRYRLYIGQQTSSSAQGNITYQLNSILAVSLRYYTMLILTYFCCVLLVIATSAEVDQMRYNIVHLQYALKKKSYYFFF